MKEVVITQVDGGYIVREVGPQGVVKVSVRPNFGAAVKIARTAFGEDRGGDESVKVEAKAQ